jgi:superfamily I DNA/RNA helicase
VGEETLRHHQVKLILSSGHGDVKQSALLLDFRGGASGKIGWNAPIASTYPSRERFLTELTLDPPDATSDEAGVPLLDEDYLVLSTIHSAKGREWSSVFLLNTVDGAWWRSRCGRHKDRAGTP